MLLVVSVVLPIRFDAGWLGHLATPAATLLSLLACSWLARHSDAGDLPGAQYLETLAVLFPGLALVKEKLESHRATIKHNSELVTRMQAALAVYGLGNVRAMSATLLGDATQGTAERLEPRTCAERAAPHVQLELRRELKGRVDDESLADTALITDVCRLLYADAHAPGTENELWNDKERRDQLVPLLAHILMRHERLREQALVRVFDTTDVAAALQTLPVFDFDQVVAQLREQPHAVVDTMVDVLETYKLGTLSAAASKKVLNALVYTPWVDLPADCARLTVEALHSAAPARPPVSPLLLELLYRERSDRPTSRLWSKHKSDLAPEVAAALLERTLDAVFPGQLAALLQQLANGIWPMALSLPEELNEIFEQVRIVRERLDEGLVPHADLTVLDRLLKTLGHDLAARQAEAAQVSRVDLGGVLGELQAVRATLDRGVALPTGQLDRLDQRVAALIEEVRTRRPEKPEATPAPEVEGLPASRWARASRRYVITFDSAKGPLADLVDVLAKPTGNQRALLGQLVKFAAKDGGRFYAFEHDTPYSRVGTLPAGVSYDEFWARFSDDFQAVVARRTEVLPGWRHEPNDLQDAVVTMRLLADARRLDCRIVVLPEQPRSPSALAA
jgi:hypothetical protein